MNRSDLRHPQWTAAIASFCVLLLAGCGIGTQSNPISSASTGAIGGILHGGPNPIVNATMNLYSTGTTGYGSGSTLLATTFSGSYGQFTFPANSCVAGSEVYVTAAGGNTGGQAMNPNSVLMAVVGDCANVNASTFTFVSEATTTAAAYALSNFTTITGTGAATVVSVGAPAANAAATPSCTGTGSSMVCTAAGLKHAFANAANLVNQTTGAVYTTTPSNASGVVPTVLLNTIADIVQSCVNSTGGVAGDGTTTCGTLFSNTTPPMTSTTTPITPVNTLQALINLAKYPSMTSAQVTALYGLSSANAFFQPTLTTAPNDFSVGIYYTGVTIGGTTTPFVYPFYLALDYNDDVYFINATASNAGPVTAAAISPNGSSLFNSSTITTSACQAGVPCVAAPDTNGTLWLAFGSTTNGSLYPISTATGTIGTAIAAGSGIPLAGLAVDKYNTVFASVPLASAANSIYSLAAGATTLSPVQANGAAISETAIPLAMFIDGSGSLWNTSKYTAGTVVSTTYLANTGTTATAFGGPAVQTVDDAAANAHGGAYGLVVDSNGTGWTNGGGEANKITAAAYLYKATAANSTVTSTLIQNGSVFAVSPRYSAIDGANNIIIPDNNGSAASYIWQYFPATGNFVNLLPCAVASATTVCSTTAASATLSGPRNAQIDSTGSIWVSSSTNGHIVQVIGTAAPTWPQLSYGHPGVKPQ